MTQQIDFDPSVDYYGVLGVSEGSAADEIKKAYRKLAKLYHPDSTGGDKAKETKFKAISSAYNVLGDPQKRELYDQIRANGGAIPVYGEHSGDFNLSDLFKFFSHQQHQQGAGTRVRVVDFESTRRPQPETSRRRPPTEPPEPSTVRASDGSWLRVDGFDVHSDVVISFDHAILGTTVTVATIDGKSEVRIPSGSSSGRKLRLRGKGKFNPGGFTGDHHVTVQIEVPTEIDDETKKLVGQLADRIKKKRRAP